MSSATSSDVPYRPIGMRARRSSFSGSESMNPGMTLFMRMLCDACWSQKSLVNADRPVRNTAEVGNASSGSKAA